MRAKLLKVAMSWLLTPNRSSLCGAHGGSNGDEKDRDEGVEKRR